MSTTAELRNNYPHNFRSEAIVGEIFTIYGEDLIHSDLLGESNVERIEESYEWAEIFGGHYSRCVGVRVGMIDEDVAEELEGLMRALDDYPIFDSSDYSDREYKALLEYAEEYLPSELAHELGIEETDALEQWIQENMELVWEHNDGSADDYPFNVEEIAKHVKL